MCAYRFHCTNGTDLVVDETGHMIELESDLSDRAADVALEVLLRFPITDLSAWLVTVQDGDGRQVDVIGFDELLDLACRKPRVLATFGHGQQEAHAPGA
ncbi:DUF6894 family protein [Salinarimonas soli]|uniref:DUF6894 domain-containing protein n=1 Tax=Salinarimonas soli TaxID=1638099 RepID=A0A5B2VGN2_9HYPH|nr:hypothetical protein [Salinarimonas soli]KAA2237788.1 hypothetical protein F0L46_08945 [Salinarimonas soli]